MFYVRQWLMMQYRLWAAIGLGAGIVYMLSGCTFEQSTPTLFISPFPVDNAAVHTPTVAVYTVTPEGADERRTTSAIQGATIIAYTAQCPNVSYSVISKGHFFTVVAPPHDAPPGATAVPKTVFRQGESIGWVIHWSEPVQIWRIDVGVASGETAQGNPINVPYVETTQNLPTAPQDVAGRIVGVLVPGHYVLSSYIKTGCPPLPYQMVRTSGMSIDTDFTVVP